MSPPQKYNRLESKDDTGLVGGLESAPSDDDLPFLGKSSDTIWESPDHQNASDNDDDAASQYQGPDFEEGEGIHAHVEGSSSNLSGAFSGAAHGSQHGLSESQEHTDQSDLELQRQRGPAELSAKQRLLNVVHYLFPVRQTYERLSNGITTGRMQPNTPGRFVGQGTDGVFRNLMAKPDTELNRVMQEQHPPTYEEAAADSTPEYWESTMISPMYEDEVFVQGLPVGNLANFVWNVLVTVAFQLIGFILCYLLHTSHAAKQGTRAGLGITLFMYGYSIIPTNFGRSDRIPLKYEPEDPNLIDISTLSSIKTGSHLDTYVLGFQQHQDSGSLLLSSKTPYFAYGLMAFGIFVIIKAMVDFYNIKQAELQILAPLRRETTHTVTDAVDGNDEEGP